jgi:hypothetical protein
MNDVFWLVDTTDIALPLLSLFPSNTPFGIPYSVYDSIISIYWSISLHNEVKIITGMYKDSILIWNINSDTCVGIYM